MDSSSASEVKLQVIMTEKKRRAYFDLPIDIVTEILSRLPSKSLLRSKSVCKEWYDLIRNPNFIDKHQKNSLTIISILATIRERMYFEDEGFYKSVNLESLFFTKKDRFDVLSICNGLICVQFRGKLRSGCIIGNPTIREFRRIPSHKLWNMKDDLLYIGFSFFLNDYKLVRVRYRSSLIGEVVVKTEVYSMSTDTWVEINVRMRRVNTVKHLIRRHAFELMPEFHSGVFYWMGGSFSEARIVSFDISDGFYDEINIPTSIIDVEESSWTVVKIKEEVSLIIYDDNCKFEVWALPADGKSWTCTLWVDGIPIVSRVKSTITVVDCRGNGELLIVNRCGNDLVLLLYDLNSRKTRTLPSVDVQKATDFYFYTESLVSVNALYEVI